MRKVLVIFCIMLMLLSACKLALKTAKVSMKEEARIQKEQAEKERFMQAVLAGDTSICDPLSSLDKFECLTKIAFYREEPILCNQIRPGEETVFKDYCRVISGKNITECDTLPTNQMPLPKACKAVIEHDLVNCIKAGETEPDKICAGFYADIYD